MHARISSLFKLNLASVKAILPGSFLGITLYAGITLSPQQILANPPTLENGKIVFEIHNMRIEIDPELAGRISSVKLDGEEFIITEGATEQRGSTFWPSPQNWPWPPPRALDSQPYNGGIDGDSVVLTSGIDESTGLRFRKTYIGNHADTSILIRYAMINEKASAINVGPWEVTRIPKTGLSFWLKGDGQTPNELPEMSGAIWFDWSDPQTTRKIFADASDGWLTHVNSKGQFLIKKFEDTPESQKAPNENEIEIYTASNFFELEHQGPYTEIAPGDSLIWEVKWYLRSVPEISVEAGNEELIEIVESVISLPTVAISQYRHKGIDRPGEYFLRFGGNTGNYLNLKGQQSQAVPQLLIQKH